jgi:hypothetical protein
MCIEATNLIQNNEICKRFPHKLYYFCIFERFKDTFVQKKKQIHLFCSFLANSYLCTNKT